MNFCIILQIVIQNPVKHLRQFSGKIVNGLMSLSSILDVFRYPSELSFLSS